MLSILRRRANKVYHKPPATIHLTVSSHFSNTTIQNHIFCNYFIHILFNVFHVFYWLTVIKPQKNTSTGFISNTAFCSSRAALMRSVRFVTSSSQPGRTTGCPNTPPHSWPSFAGSKPATHQMQGQWLSTAGTSVFLWFFLTFQFLHYLEQKKKRKTFLIVEPKENKFDPQNTYV